MDRDTTDRMAARLARTRKPVSDQTLRRWERQGLLRTRKVTMTTPEADPIRTVSLPESEWQALLSVEPLAKETYTGEGEAIFNAFQAIRQTVDSIAGIE